MSKPLLPLFRFKYALFETESKKEEGIAKYPRHLRVDVLVRGRVTLAKTLTDSRDPSEGRNVFICVSVALLSGRVRGLYVVVFLHFEVITGSRGHKVDGVPVTTGRG